MSSNLTASANPLKMTPKMHFGPLVVHSGKKMAISSYSDGWENNLRNRGWQLFARNTVNPSLKELIECLDYRSIRISKLDLKAAQNARPNSLSSRYGLEKFPPHTDFVLEKIPATYTILWASNPRNVKTCILDSNELISAFGKDFINACLFKVNDSNITFYCNLCTNQKYREFFRYNAAIMTPVNSQAEAVHDFIQRQWKPTAMIDWKETRLAIINNWKIFHSREALEINPSKNSYIRRIAIWSEYELGCQ